MGHDAVKPERPRGLIHGTYMTRVREELLEAVANLEISLDEGGAYRWLGGRKVNAMLAELESEGWLVFETDTAVPHITGVGRIALRQAKAAGA